MSSECERAFSSAKRMITDERYNLKNDIIEALSASRAGSNTALQTVLTHSLILQTTMRQQH